MFDLKGSWGGRDPVGKEAARWPVVASAIACAVLIGGALASSAAAFHIPGAAYSGNVRGGSITFSVSGDGSSVTNLALTGPIQGSNCTLNSRQYTQPTPITNNAFDNGEVSGSFPNVQGAYGHLDIVVFGILSSCTVTGTWSAITSASPARSEECKAAQARVKKWKRALSNATKAGNEAKIKQLRKKWKRARSNRDRIC